MDDLCLDSLLDEDRDGDIASFLLFLRDEGLQLLAAYRAIDDRDVRAALHTLILNIAFPGDRPGGDGPLAA